MDDVQKTRLAYIMGTLSGIHSELIELEDDEIDGALCSLEDAWTVLSEKLTGEPSAVALARAL